MLKVTLSSGRAFDCDPGETILDAAARAHVLLPYSCRTGRCSTCKCKVLEGDTRPLHEEVGLSSAEKAAGWILSCVREPVDEVTLEVDDLGDLVLSDARTLPCRIHGLRALAPDVLEVVLRLPPGADFRFHAGQYIDVIGPNGVRRSYSLANAAAADQLLQLHIRAVPDGVMSRYWFGEAKVNDLLRLHGPLGTFVLRETRDMDLVLLATGTGIAPVKSMLESLAVGVDGPRSVTVYWGGRMRADLYWPIERLPGSHRYVPVLSRPDAEWSGVRGHVQDALLAAVPDLGQTIVYACGSDAMVHAARLALTRAGLPPHRFRSDSFVCSDPT